MSFFLSVDFILYVRTPDGLGVGMAWCDIILLTFFERSFVSYLLDCQIFFKLNNKYQVLENIGKQEHSWCWWECTTILESSLTVSGKIKNVLRNGPALAFIPGIWQRNSQLLHKKTCPRLHIVALLKQSNTTGSELLINEEIKWGISSQCNSIQ